MSTRKRRKPSVSQPVAEMQAAPGDGTALIFGVTALGTALLAARVLLPTEAAAAGQTLWIVQLWLLAALLWIWNGYRQSHWTFRVGWLDAALWLLIAGQVISGLAVFVVGGDRRAAVNMIWEWIGLGVSFFLLRQLFVDPRVRAAVIRMFLALAVCLAGLGLWQHYVWYPRIAAEYAAASTELRRLEQEPLPTDSASLAVRQRRLRELQSRVRVEGVELEGAARRLFEDRLQNSREPFGLFALANTFAGWLIAWLLVALGQLRAALSGHRSWRQVVPLLLICLLIAWCLVLTKSRTAWVGLLAGLGTWTWFQFRRVPPRYGLAAAAAVSFAVLVIILLVAFGGGLDWQVWSEAPKSLRYRFEYWTATAQMLRQSPLLGVGPGNFRQHYLRYKLPESSEEIADPHNLLLDLWSSGGIVSVLGLLAVLIAGVRLFRESASDRSADHSDQPRANPALLVGAAIGFVLVFLYLLLFEYDIDPRLFALLIPWAGIVWWLSRANAVLTVQSGALAAGLVALGVHLLGAGGISMPTIAQTLLLFLALATPTDLLATMRPATPQRLGLSGFASLALFLLCLLTATGPVLSAQTALAAGNLAVMDGFPRRADEHYQAAAKADPLAPEPWARRAELAFQQWNASGASNDLFDRAVAFQQEALRRDPDSPHRYRRLAEWWTARFLRTAERNAGESAVAAFREAVERYPTNALLRAEYAQALSRMGDSAQAAAEARVALQFDEINHRLGHLDRLLSDKIRDEMQRLAEQADRE